MSFLRRLLRHRRLRRDRLRRADRLAPDAFLIPAVVLQGADGQFDGAADPVLVVRPVGLDERVHVRLVQRKLIAALEGRDRFVVLAGRHRHDDFLSRSVAQGFDGDE